MKFFDELDEYVVLKLPLDDFKGATKTLERNFEMAGYEVRGKIRKDERKLLKSFFHNWALPYYGTLNGWREDSPIYALHNGTLIGGSTYVIKWSLTRAITGVSYIIFIQAIPIREEGYIACCLKRP